MSLPSKYFNSFILKKKVLGECLHHQDAYPLLPWNGAFPIHQVHRPIWIFRWHSNKALVKSTPFFRHIDAMHTRLAIGLCTGTLCDAQWGD